MTTQAKPRKGSKGTVTDKVGIPGLPVGVELQVVQVDGDQVLCQYRTTVPARGEDGAETTATVPHTLALTPAQWAKTKRGK